MMAAGIHLIYIDLHYQLELYMEDIIYKFHLLTKLTFMHIIQSHIYIHQVRLSSMEHMLHKAQL